MLVAVNLPPVTYTRKKIIAVVSVWVNTHESIVNEPPEERRRTVIWVPREEEKWKSIKLTVNVIELERAYNSVEESELPKERMEREEEDEEVREEKVRLRDLATVPDAAIVITFCSATLNRVTPLFTVEQGKILIPQ
jgi:broad specificity polyphosphatase/5'/3'-nucleotidase SurE